MLRSAQRKEATVFSTDVVCHAEQTLKHEEKEAYETKKQLEYTSLARWEQYKNQWQSALRDVLAQNEQTIQQLKQQRQTWDDLYDQRLKTRYDELEMELFKTCHLLQEEDLFTDQDFSTLQQKLEEDRQLLLQQIDEENKHQEEMRENNSRQQSETKKKLETYTHQLHQLDQHLIELAEKLEQFQQEKEALIASFDEKKRSESFDTVMPTLEPSYEQKVRDDLDFVGQFIPQQDIQRHVDLQYEYSKEVPHMTPPTEWTIELKPRYSTKEWFDKLNILSRLKVEKESLSKTHQIIQTIGVSIIRFFAILFNLLKWPLNIGPKLFRFVYGVGLAIFLFIIIGTGIPYAYDMGSLIARIIWLLILFILAISVFLLLATILHYLYVKFIVSKNVYKRYAKNLPYYALIKLSELKEIEKAKFLAEQEAYNENITKQCEKAVQAAFPQSEEHQITIHIEEHQKKKENIQQQQKQTTLHLEQLKATRLDVLERDIAQSIHFLTISKKTLPSYLYLQTFIQQTIRRIQKDQHTIQRLHDSIDTVSKEHVTSLFAPLAEWITVDSTQFIREMEEERHQYAQLEETTAQFKIRRTDIQQMKKSIFERVEAPSYLELQQGAPHTLLMKYPTNGRSFCLPFQKMPNVIVYDASSIEQNDVFEEALLNLVNAFVVALHYQSAKKLNRQYIINEFLTKTLYGQLRHLDNLSFHSQLDDIEKIAAKSKHHSENLSTLLSTITSAKENHHLEYYIQHYMEEEDLENISIIDHDFIYSDFQFKYEFVHLIWPTARLNTSAEKIPRFESNWNALIHDKGQFGFIPFIYVETKQWNNPKLEEHDPALYQIKKWMTDNHFFTLSEQTLTKWKGRK